MEMALFVIVLMLSGCNDKEVADITQAVEQLQKEAGQSEDGHVVHPNGDIAFVDDSNENNLLS